jgi:hypothetical protein
MDAPGRRALSAIRRCIEAGHFTVLRHFTRRMDQRGLVWPDVLAAIDRPGDVRGAGRDRFNRPKWIVTGDAPDGLPIELVCVLDVNERGDMTVFITIY